MYIIAGLGNPSIRYRHTRHNVGFDAIDALAKKYNILIKKTKYQAKIGEGIIKGERVLLLKPQTYMNKSGESILMALKMNNINAEEKLVVLVDDTALSCGEIRVRPGGSAGGHNGLKSIIGNLSTDRFMRIRIGIGKPFEKSNLIKYVLSRPSRNDLKLLKTAYSDTIGAIEAIVEKSVEAAMNAYNGKHKE